MLYSIIKMYKGGLYMIKENIKERKNRNMLPTNLDGTKKKKKLTDSQKKEERTAWMILSPMFLWWIAACGFPLVFGFALAFMEWRSVIELPVFVGLDNFVTFFTDPTYLKILGQTVFLGFGSTFLTTVCGLFVAILMYQPIKMSGIYRAVWYMPSVVSTVAVTQIIGIVFDPVNGALNAFLESIGEEGILLSSDKTATILVIFLFSVWKGVGGSAIVWLAGLLSIDKLQYEAASIDGANGLQKFWYVTLPGLKPMSIYIIITGLMGMLQIYEPIAFISNGAPYGETEVLAFKIIKDGFFDSDFGMSGASSVVLGVLVIIMSVWFYRYSNKKED